MVENSAERSERYVNASFRGYDLSQTQRKIRDSLSR